VTEIDAAPPTFASAPPERIDIGGGALLVRCRTDRSAAAVAAVNTSLDHLRPWMAWAGAPTTEAAMATFFAASEELWEQRRDFGYSIVDPADTVVLGGCGLHGRLGPHGLEIGYWVHVDHIGQGLATAASRGLTDAALSIEGIDRVRIQCVEDNVRSARVPAKLGFTLEGVSVQEDGPCAGRPTQVWSIDRPTWIAGRLEPAP